jgi:hypothetical protein
MPALVMRDFPEDTAGYYTVGKIICNLIFKDIQNICLSKYNAMILLIFYIEICLTCPQTVTDIPTETSQTVKDIPAKPKSTAELV